MARRLRAATELQDRWGAVAPLGLPGARADPSARPPYPLTIDHERLRRLKDDFALYRLTFGQPRQEDLLNVLRSQGIQTNEEQAARLRLDLSPPLVRNDGPR